MTSFIILSGLSGSGKSTAIKVFEDIGYYCVDNLPPELLSKFAELCENPANDITHAAFVMDVREGVFFDTAPGAIRALKHPGNDVQVLFLEATDEALVRRFKETRRKHPLNPEGNLLESIRAEREKLGPIRALADNTLDTTPFNIHQLRDILIETYGKPTGRSISLNFFSFGFKHGFPHDADLVIDVRFLPNPHYDGKLRPLTGKDKAVQDYISASGDTGVFIKKLVDLLRFLLPRYQGEGKSYLTVAFGCTGGAHRSVFVAERVADEFADLLPNVWHRDINRSMG